VSTAQTSERDERDKRRLRDYDQMVGLFFEQISKELINQIRTLNQTISETLQAKTEWEGINEQYAKFSSYLDQVF